MTKAIQIFFFVAIVGLALVNRETHARSIDSSALEKSLDKELRRKIFLEELNEYDKKLDQKLLDYASGKRIKKRSDIDARLLELQAKILLTKAYAQMPAGHGRFNFDEIGKRSVDSNEIFEEAQRALNNDFSSEDKLEK